MHAYNFPCIGLTHAQLTQRERERERERERSLPFISVSNTQAHTYMHACIYLPLYEGRIVKADTCPYNPSTPVSDFCVYTCMHTWSPMCVFVYCVCVSKGITRIKRRVATNICVCVGVCVGGCVRICNKDIFHFHYLYVCICTYSKNICNNNSIFSIMYVCMYVCTYVCK